MFRSNCRMRWRFERIRCAGLTALTLAAVAAASLIPAVTSFADVLNFQITMDGFTEVPPNDSLATGAGTATLDTSTNMFSWNVSFSGLLSDETAAHFHGPAGYCATAPPAIVLPLGSPIIGSSVVTSDQAQDIIHGQWYLNVHSADFPSGEIRGQVEPAAPADVISHGIAPGDIRVGLQLVADGMAAPNWGVPAPGHADRLFVVDQTGICWNVNLGTGQKSVFLDVSSRMVPLGIFGPGTYDERGFLGLAFSPDYSRSGLIYTFTSEPYDPNDPPDFSTMPPGSTPNCISAVIQWRVNQPKNADATVDPNSARVLLRIAKPQFNHNGGCMNFGPDGMLYITLGDGGNGDDQDGGFDPFGLPNLGHDCDGNGQNLESILGKFIRIDPSGHNSANGQYGIPSDNPFVNQAGLDEIWAYGFRNPFRFSFDSATGLLYSADVGQNNVEEIDIVHRSGNYGWNIKEGTFRFVRNGLAPGYAADPSGLIAKGLIDPIAEYDHDEGISVTGGFVYHGSLLPNLQGDYVFGDFSQHFASDGRLFYLKSDQANTMFEFQIEGQSNLGFFLNGFGQDAHGEVYALGDTTAAPGGTTGAVYRIVPQFDIALRGSCPGVITVAAQGATPGGVVAILAANGAGGITIPNGVQCAGTSLGLNSSVQVVGTARANADGVAVLRRTVPPTHCGGNTLLQALDLGTCATSTVQTIQ